MAKKPARWEDDPLALEEFQRRLRGQASIVGNPDVDPSANPFVRSLRQDTRREEITHEAFAIARQMIDQTVLPQLRREIEQTLRGFMTHLGDAVGTKINEAISAQVGTSTGRLILERFNRLRQEFERRFVSIEHHLGSIDARVDALRKELDEIKVKGIPRPAKPLPNNRRRYSSD